MNANIEKQLKILCDMVRELENDDSVSTASTQTPDDIGVDFTQKAWGLALHLLEKSSGDYTDDFLMEDVTEAWNKLDAVQRVSVMKKYLEDIAERVRWSLRTAIRVFNKDV